MLNFESGNSYGESTYRKEYAAFNRGREYERQLNDSNIFTRILSISDTHVPFQLPVSTYAQYAGRVDILQLNGDIMDCQAISRFPKTYRISPMEEMIQARQYLIDLIELIRPKKVIATYGNHDMRFQSYFAKNLDSDLLELMPETALDLIFDDGFRHYDKRSRSKSWYEPLAQVFEGSGIEICYTGDWKCKIGKTWFCHPCTASGAALKTVENAASYFHLNDKETFDAVIMAHTHKVAHEKLGYVHLFEQGACCDTKHMTYTDGKLMKPQKEGFVYLRQDKDGNMLEDKFDRIILN